MSYRVPTVRALLFVVAFLGVGCGSESDDPGWQCDATVNVTGVWDLRRVPRSGAGISCLDLSNTWTLTQNGCDVTVVSQPWDPANGKSGTVTGNRLQLNWVYFEGCYRYEEEYDLTVDGDTWSGVYYLSRSQWVFPADCPGTGLCSSAVTGTRRVP